MLRGRRPGGGAFEHSGGTGDERRAGDDRIVAVDDHRRAARTDLIAACRHDGCGDDPTAPPTTTTPAAADPCALLTAEEVSLTTEGTFTARQDEVFGFAQCWFRGGPIDDLVRLSVRQIDPAALEAVRDEFLTATMGTAASRRRSPSGMSAHARSS